MLVARSGGIPDKKKSEEIKSWFLPNTFHVFRAHSPTLSVRSFLVHLPCLCFCYDIKTHLLWPPNMDWRNETPQESSKPSPTHWQCWDIQLCGLTSYWVIRLSTWRQCGNTHIWSKLINFFLIYIISMRSVPLENLTSTEFCPSSYIDNTAVYLLCLSLSFPILPVLSHLLPYSYFPKKIYRTLFFRRKASVWDLMVFYITKYFFLFHMPVKNHICKGTFFFPSMSSFHQHFFWHFFWYSWRMSNRHKLYRIPKQTVHFLKHHLGLLIYEAGKGNMQMPILICIELIPLTVFLGFLMFLIIFSVYTYRTFFPCQKEPRVSQVSMLSAAWGYRNSECSL